MSEEMDRMKYFIAAEKVHGLLGAIDRLLEFIEEFKIEPDDAVRNELKPYLEKLNEWIKDG